jgi:hypothetical protein
LLVLVWRDVAAIDCNPCLMVLWQDQNEVIARVVSEKNQLL